MRTSQQFQLYPYPRNGRSAKLHKFHRNPKNLLEVRIMKLKRRVGKPISHLVNKATLSSLAGIIVALFFISIFALLPNSVRAQCGQWDVSGKWTLNVTNGMSEILDLKQSGEKITGESIAYSTGAKVIGTIKGDDFSLTIDWSAEGRTFGPGAASFEVFLGKIGPDGVITGHATTLSKPDLSNTKNPWSSDRPMKCLYKPINRLKIKPTTPTDPVVSAPATLTAPGIIASPNNIKVIAGKSSGQTTLTWDGGRAHRNAEVWVKVDDQDETSVVKSGKGTLQVAVVPGKTYVYTLKDKGQVIATVTVKFHR
jgi:hypothetical protein